MYVYIYIYIHIHTYIHTYIHTRIQVSMKFAYLRLGRGMGMSVAAHTLGAARFSVRLDIRQRGVQWEGGAVDWCSII